MKLFSNITSNHAQSALDLTAEILNKTGPRLTGTDACRRAGKLIKSNLDKSCDETSTEQFQFSRDAFLFHIRYFSFSYAMAFIFLWMGGNWIYAASFITILGCIMVLLEFVFYFEFIDPVFKKTTGFNISGIIKPEKKIEQQVIISGHYDSPHVFRFLNKHQRLYKFRVALNSILYLFITLVSLWFSWVQFININIDTVIWCNFVENGKFLTIIKPLISCEPYKYPNSLINNVFHFFNINIS